MPLDHSQDIPVLMIETERLIIRPLTDNKMVGDLCFMGEPGESGEIEIGYGTYEEFRQKGYMTEAVGGMIQWAHGQPGVYAVLA